MSDSITFDRHNDFVGDEASMGRIPGAEDASTGHHFVAVDPMTGGCPLIDGASSTLLPLKSPLSLLGARWSVRIDPARRWQPRFRSRH